MSVHSLSPCLLLVPVFRPLTASSSQYLTIGILVTLILCTKNFITRILPFALLFWNTYIDRWMEMVLYWRRTDHPTYIPRRGVHLFATHKNVHSSPALYILFGISSHIPYFSSHRTQAIRIAGRARATGRYRPLQHVLERRDQRVGPMSFIFIALVIYKANVTTTSPVQSSPVLPERKTVIPTKYSGRERPPPLRNDTPQKCRHRLPSVVVGR
jgi:hypothetical protein